MNAMRRLTKGSLAGRRPWSLARIGVVSLALLAVAVLALAFKAEIGTVLRSGQTITAEFDRNYQILADETRVKLSGIEVGIVSDVETTEEGTVLVSMKIEESAMDALGPKPSAEVTPNTVLGGSYSVELKRGGGEGTFEGERIPRERTKTPVELDRILEALPSPTRENVQTMVKRLDKTLKGGKVALRDLLAHAPDTLKPAGLVLEAAQGTRPGVDLPQIVSNFHATADVLSKYDGQLGEIVTSLRDTTHVLAKQSRPLADGIESLPATLRSTRTGITELRGTLDKLTVTADSFRPAAKRLDPLLRQLDPVLRRVEPLMRDLRPLMRDTRPLVDQLVPVARRGTAMLNDMRGPVLDRVNGPISDTLMNTWHGTGPYKDSGGGMQADHKMYEEIGYLVTNLDRASMTQDAQGSLLNFQVGVNTSSVAGLPLTLPNLVEQMEKHAGGTR